VVRPSAAFALVTSWKARPHPLMTRHTVYRQVVDRFMARVLSDGSPPKCNLMVPDTDHLRVSRSGSIWRNSQGAAASGTPAL